MCVSANATSRVRVPRRARFDWLVKVSENRAYARNARVASAIDVNAFRIEKRPLISRDRLSAGIAWRTRGSSRFGRPVARPALRGLQFAPPRESPIEDLRSLSRERINK